MMKRLGTFIAIALVLLSAMMAGCLSSKEKNKPPIALFEVSTRSVNEGGNVTFDASGSQDSDGEIERYQWNFGDGHTDQGVQLDHTFKGGGDFNVSLTVTDNDGDKDVTSLMVHVNEYPDAEGGPSKAQATIYEAVTFDASFSNDPDGSLVEFTWDFGDGAKKVTTSKAMDHSYNEIGSYNVSLVVKDNDGATDSVTSKITICMRKFQVLWSETLRKDLAGKINGHTDEPSNNTNDTRETITNKTIKIETMNLTRIIFELNWSDDIPIVRANNDDFKITVTDPEGNSLSVEGVGPPLQVDFELGTAPQNTTFEAKNIQDVRDSIGDTYEKSNGIGTWRIAIECIDAGDLVWIDNELFEDLDTGNDWTVSVHGYTFEYTVVDLGTGG
jgi:PKD repeat protein